MTSLPTQENFDWTIAFSLIKGNAPHQWLVYFAWRMNGSADHLVQVYVNDRLYDVTIHPGQRELWLTLDRSREHRIELLALPIAEALDPWLSHHGLLMTWQPQVGDHPALAVVRDEALPIDATFTVEVAGHTETRAVWTARDARSGHGAVFGIGGFGYDNSTHPDFEFEDDGSTQTAIEPQVPWRWSDDSLPAGDHTLQVLASDEHGLPVSTPLVVDPFHVDRLPTPAKNLAVTSDNRLTWTT